MHLRLLLLSFTHLLHFVNLLHLANMAKQLARKAARGTLKIFDLKSRIQITARPTVWITALRDISTSAFANDPHGPTTMVKPKVRVEDPLEADMGEVEGIYGRRSEKPSWARNPPMTRAEAIAKVLANMDAAEKAGAYAYETYSAIVSSDGNVKPSDFTVVEVSEGGIPVARKASQTRK